MLYSSNFTVRSQEHHNRQNKGRGGDSKQASHMILQLKMNKQKASYQMLFYLIKSLPPHLQPHTPCTQHSKAMLHKKEVEHLCVVFHPSVFPFLAKPEYRLPVGEAKMQCCLATTRDFPQQPLLILPLETSTSQVSHEMQQLINSYLHRYGVELK